MSLDLDLFFKWAEFLFGLIQTVSGIYFGIRNGRDERNRERSRQAANQEEEAEPA